MGIEPMTFCLEGKRSTSELHSRVKLLMCCVGVTGLEPMTSASQTQRATNCATPRYKGLLYHRMVAESMTV